MTAPAGRAVVLRADARRLPLRDASVDLVVTSPPYFSLRSYGAGPGEIGSEAHWRDWLDALVACTAEMARVLKPTGSIWVNLADKYAEGWGGSDPKSPGRQNGHGGPPGARAKSLMLLPERYAIACVDQLGLICRRDQIWWKANPLPESVDDRTRSGHEYVYHLTRQGDYYAALDELREPHTWGREIDPEWAETRKAWGNGSQGRPQKNDSFASLNPLGKLPGSVWRIASEPLRLPPWRGVLGGRTVQWFPTYEAAATWARIIGTRRGRPSIRPEVSHYAAFPPSLPERIVRGWSPPGVCLACGQGRFPVVERTYDAQGRTTNGPQSIERRFESPGREVRMVAEATVLGYACACCPYTDHPGSGGGSGEHYSDRDGEGINGSGYPRTGYSTELHARPRTGPWREWHLDAWTPPPTRPAVVLDPFSGTGTTIGVSRSLGRIGIGVDLSWDYCRLARCRVFHVPAWKASGAALTAAPRPKPAKPAPAGQTSLLFGASP